MTAKSNAIEKPAQKSALALVKEQVVDQVAKRVDAFIQNGQLHLPPEYSAHNAMHAAWLVLQDVKDSTGKLALEACTRASIANALFRMIVQGLDPIKDQCYFIAYGKHLACQRSYFGTIAQAQRMAGVADVLPMVRYEGEEFQLAIERGRYVVDRHVPSIDVKRDTPITHAYCIVEWQDGRPPATEVMRWDQILMSWRKSKTYKADGKSGPHHEQPDQMAIRTIVNRALKRPLKASTDAHLAEALEQIERADAVAAAESEMEIEIGEHANREMLTLDAGDESEHEPEGEPLEDEPTDEEIEEIRAQEQAEADPALFHDERASSGKGPGY